jgi:hypothetical protein
MRQERHNACETCGAEFLTEEELTEHRTEVHPLSAGALSCRLCGQQLGSAEELDEHLRRDHGVEVAETVPCGECGLVFAGPDALEEHMDQEHPQRAGMGQGP